MRKFDFSGKKNICGNSIRNIRIARHMSQATLAIKMQAEGVIMEQDVISRIELGDRLVTDYELRAFSAVFGVSIERLLTADGKE